MQNQATRQSLPVLAVVYLGFFLWALCFAMIEIAIEGPVGWALAAPTWRTMNPVYAALMNGKELTGYHLVMFFLPILLLHLPFAFGKLWGGIKWTLGKELEIFAIYALLCFTWDFLWFVLNPHFTLAHFRPGEIWWHANWVGPVPSDYLGGVVIVVILTTVVYYRWDKQVRRRMAAMATTFVLATLVTIAVAPVYHRWYTGKVQENGGLSSDWKKRLNPDDYAAMEAAMKRLAADRAEIVRFGKKGAETEQLHR